MVHVEVGDSTAVTDDEILEAPFVAQNLLEQSRTAAAWIIIEALVGTHHLTYLCILHQCLKGRHVGLPEITCRNVGQVGCMTGVLWSAVYGIVFGTSP